jgi:YVTN family beta-propeller protein
MAPEDHPEGPALDTVSIGVSATPHSVAVSRDGARLYVTHFLSGSVTVIDTATNSVTATIDDLPSGTYGVAVSADGKFLFLANPHGQFLRKILADGSASAERIDAGVGSFCYGLAMSPHGDVLYATCAMEDQIILLDNLVMNIGKISGIDFPVGVAASPDSTRLYATNYSSQTVSVIDIKSADSPVIAKIDVPLGPYGVAASPDGARVYIAHFHADDLVSVIDTASLKVVDKITTGSGPVRGVAVSPDGGRLYVTNYFSNSVSVIPLGA